ncbi:exported protein of unknown function [Streptantibioticus cattleyicolor NRRL 8057 = DSM 46488]|nr:exported protein of unknown function [Streptantibioticus cattleyicolor NRRL 8057 = DSM 46488]
MIPCALCGTGRGGGAETKGSSMRLRLLARAGILAGTALTATASIAGLAQAHAATHPATASMPSMAAMAAPVSVTSAGLRAVAMPCDCRPPGTDCCRDCCTAPACRCCDPGGTRTRAPRESGRHHGGADCCPTAAGHRGHGSHA